MKKILLLTLLLTSTACSSVIKTAAYFAVAPYVGPAIVIPELVIEWSAEQRAFNAANGIHHSREERSGRK